MDADKTLDEIVQKMKNQPLFQDFRRANKNKNGGHFFQKQNSPNHLRSNNSTNFKARHNNGRPFMRNQNQTFPGNRRFKGGARNTQTILLSGLAPTVTFDDLIELFSMFKDKPLVKMHYNHKGVMIGTAEITFNDKISAQKAIQTYDGVPLDKYKMSLTLVQRHSPETVYTRLGSKQNGSKFYRQGKNHGKEEPNKDELDAEMDEYMAKRDA